MAAKPIADTDRARNINVVVDGRMDLDEMEQQLEAAGTSLGLVLTHITTLSKKKYPGNRHWHFKEAPKTRGTLDITYWPDGPLLWITVRNLEPEWVHSAGDALAEAMNARV